MHRSTCRGWIVPSNRWRMWVQRSRATTAVARSGLRASHVESKFAVLHPGALSQMQGVRVSALSAQARYLERSPFCQVTQMD